jgi:hypothetical protein
MVDSDPTSPSLDGENESPHDACDVGSTLGFLELPQGWDTKGGITQRHLGANGDTTKPYQTKRKESVQFIRPPAMSRGYTPKSGGYESPTPTREMRYGTISISRDHMFSLHLSRGTRWQPTTQHVHISAPFSLRVRKSWTRRPGWDSRHPTNPSCSTEVRKPWCTKVGGDDSSMHRGEARVWEVSYWNSRTIRQMPDNRDTTPRLKEGDPPWYRLRPHLTCTRITETQVLRGPTSGEVRSSETESRSCPGYEQYARGTERNP